MGVKLISTAALVAILLTIFRVVPKQRLMTWFGNLFEGLGGSLSAAGNTKLGKKSMTSVEEGPIVSFIALLTYGLQRFKVGFLKDNVLLLCALLLPVALYAEDPIDALDDVYVINVSASDSVMVPVQRPRGIFSSTEGKIRVKFRNRGREYTDIVELPAFVWTPLKNMVMVYKYTSGTNLTSCSVTDAGDTLCSGVKVGK